jgi:predicted metal-dependent phosphoesterase TrpH
MQNIHRIQFEHPDLGDLTKKFTVVDLHFHTKFSDGLNSIDEIAQELREKNIGIAITDHNAIQGAVELDEYKDVFSIPGIEITSAIGTHILVYFYEIEELKIFFEKDVKPHMGTSIMSSIALSVADIIKKARLYNAVIIFPHPYCSAYPGVQNKYISREELVQFLKEVDGVEVINSESLHKWNLKSALLGFNLNKSITGGSDGHSLYQLGKVVSYAKCEKTRSAFLDAIKNQTNKVIGKEVNIFRKVTANSFKLKSNLNNYPNLLEKNMRYSYFVLNSFSRSLREKVKKRVKKNLLS